MWYLSVADRVLLRGATATLFSHTRRSLGRILRCGREPCFRRNFWCHSAADVSADGAASLPPSRASLLAFGPSSGGLAAAAGRLAWPPLCGRFASGGEAAAGFQAGFRPSVFILDTAPAMPRAGRGPAAAAGRLDPAVNSVGLVCSSTVCSIPCSAGKLDALTVSKYGV